MRFARMARADFYAVLGQRLCKLRETANWSQAQMAEAVRLDRADVSRIENGKGVSLEVLRRYAAALRVPLHALLDLPREVPVANPFVKPAKKRAEPLQGEQAQLWRYWAGLGPKDRATVLGLAKMLYKHTPPVARRAAEAAEPAGEESGESDT
jgi:transcriptional regulator with XRE-family HTH domain